MDDRFAGSRPDGLTIGMHDSSVVTSQLRNQHGARYDANAWSWLGALTVDRYFYGVHTRTGLTASNLDAVKSREIKSANVTPGDTSHLLQVALKLGLGWRLTPVFGYQGQRETVLSLDRGDAQGAMLAWPPYVTKQPDDLASRIVVPLVQFGGKSPAAVAQDVPTAIDLFRDTPAQSKQILTFVETQLALSRAVSTPPNPDPRLAATMRAAFEQMMMDAEFLADANKIKLEISPISGEMVQRLVREYIGTSPAILTIIDDQVKADAQ